MILDFTRTAERIPEGHDVCVVGAGAAGISLAAELIRLGRRVLLLEAGGTSFEQKTQDLYEGQVGDRPYRMATKPRFCNVLQHEWTAGDPSASSAPGFRILYRTFGGAGQAFAQVRNDRAALVAWSDQVGVDLAEPGAFQRLMLKATYQRRPEAMILFSSTRAENVAANIQTLECASLAAAERLATLVGSALTPGDAHDG